jgi:hypothetical protein
MIKQPTTWQTTKEAQARLLENERVTTAVAMAGYAYD